MKVGLRKINLKTRLKAKTTGKLKRTIKKSINPLYGKKGMGYINNPKKAVYNKVYNKTTFSADKLFKTTGNLFVDIVFIIPIKMVYYLYKYLFLGIIWICKKIFNSLKNNENEEMV